MADKVSREKRSEVMSLVKSKNTRPEIIVRKYLFSLGFRYRLHDKTIPGKPDIKLPKYNCVIFINGCFWHGHNCEKYQMPKTNRIFWYDKIEANKSRDERNVTKLKELGWKVVVVWECELRNKDLTATSLSLLRNYILNNL